MAVGHDYRTDLHKHQSQTDAAKGFGGKFGVQKDRQDAAAVDFSYKEKLQQHASQKGSIDYLSLYKTNWKFCQILYVKHVKIFDINIIAVNCVYNNEGWCRFHQLS